MNAPVLRSVLAALGLAAAVASPTPTFGAEPTPLPGVGEVGQGIEWRGVFEPMPLAAFDTVRFEARGVVGREAGRLIGVLAITANVDGLVASGRFPALGGDEVRIVVLNGNVPVAEVVVPTDGATPAGAAALGPRVEEPTRRGPSAPVTALGDVVIVPAASPALPRSVRVSLVQRAGPGSIGGEVVPAPMLEIGLLAGAQVRIGGQTHPASVIRFLATTPFPPPGASSAILERVDVFTGSALGGVSGPSVELAAEAVEPGVLFSGVPVQPDQGPLAVRFDHHRAAISSVDLEVANGPTFLLSGEAAGVAVAWEADDLAAGPAGSSAELAAIGQNIAGVEVRGVVTATRTGDGWDLSFRPPGGLAGVPRTVEVDGEPVGEVTVPAPAGVFAHSSAPPSGASAFTIGLGAGAFYGFSWDAPAAIAVPGAGTFTGREVRLVFPAPIGPLAFGGVIIEELPHLTLTGLAAPAVDDGGPCFASETKLCLAGGRFAVEARWADPFGGGGAGVARPLTADTGTFWFFDEDNLELMVKVLDACPVNGHFWVFAGGLTNVEVDLTVTDTRTRIERTYRNAQGDAFQPIQDTAAFVCAP